MWFSTALNHCFMLFCGLWLRVGFDGWIDGLIEKGSAEAG